MQQVNSTDALIFFVMGATGTGKSAVAVQVATLLKQRYHRQHVVIINCDVTQFYTDMPIATNMSSSHQLGGIDHVFMGFLRYNNQIICEPESTFTGYESMKSKVVCNNNNLNLSVDDTSLDICYWTYNIIGYVQRVETFIKQYSQKYKDCAVIVCGGTCYYLQALLFNGMLTLQTNQQVNAQEQQNDNDCLTNVTATGNQIIRKEIGISSKNSNTQQNCHNNNDYDNNDDNDNGVFYSNGNSTNKQNDSKLQRLQALDSVWDRLNVIDPATAKRYHPHDVRRIQRLLDIYKQTGKPPSQIFSKRNVTLRWNANCMYVIWTDMQRKLLTKRLNERVDQMAKRGLFKQVYSLHKCIDLEEINTSITKAIGFKQLRHVLKANDVQCNSQSWQHNYAIRSAINEMKVNTHHYARQQIRWITNRLLPLLNDVAQRECKAVIRQHVARLDVACDVSIHNLVQQTLQLLFAKNNAEVDANTKTCIIFPLKNATIKLRPPLTRHICDGCGALIYGDEQMSIHAQSQRHRRAMKRIARRNKSSNNLQQSARAQKSRTEMSSLQSTIHDDKPIN